VEYISSEFLLKTTHLIEKSFVEINIFDIQGKKIMTKKETCQVGKNEIKINTSSLKNGIYTYFIKVNNEKVMSNKLIKK